MTKPPAANWRLLCSGRETLRTVRLHGTPRMVRCKDCGYLAVRDQLDVAKVSEATRDYRTQGRQRDSVGGNTPGTPICHIGMRTFEHRDSPSIVAETSQEFECNGFTPWIEGRSPKAHEEMSFVEQMEARTHQWRAEDLSWRRGTFWVLFFSAILSGILSGLIAGAASGYFTSLWAN